MVGADVPFDARLTSLSEQAQRIALGKRHVASTASSDDATPDPAVGGNVHRW